LTYDEKKPIAGGFSARVWPQKTGKAVFTKQQANSKVEGARQGEMLEARRRLANFLQCAKRPPNPTG